MNRTPSANRKTMSLAGFKSSALEIARGRLMFAGVVFIFAYLLIGVKAFDLTVLQGDLERIRGNAIVAPVEERREPNLRADITDRNGVLLATTLRTASLYADQAVILDAEAAARELVKIFPRLSYAETLVKLTGKRRFVWIARNLTPEEQAKVLEIGEPGLNFKTEPRRIYPQGNLVSHIVGFADIDGNGLSGIERGLNEKLAQGVEPVSLSIDLRLQYFLRREMARAIKEFNAAGGAGVILDVRNGEVMAAVSLPDFDPHDPGKASSSELFNNVTLGVFEAGSIFKIFSMAAHIERDDPQFSETFDVRQPLVRGRHTISDFHPENRILNLPEVFMLSSNIGSAMIGERVGTEFLKKFYGDLGLLSAPDYTGIPENGKPLVPQPWREINTLTASYGHGVAVSPLQIASAVATIAGDGTYVRPTFLNSAKKMAGGHRNATKNNELRIVKPQTAHRMRQLMRLVVTDGTGSKADVRGYQVGGKTGTAEKTGGRGYDRKRLLSSFVGIFPADDPVFVVLIMIDEPKGNKKSFGYATGGWVAAPAVARVIASTGTLLGIKGVPGDDDKLVDSLKKYIHKDEKEKHLASYRSGTE